MKQMMGKIAYYMKQLSPNQCCVGFFLKKSLDSFYFIGSFSNVDLSPILPILKPYCFNFKTFFSNSKNFEFIFMDTLHVLMFDIV